MKIQQFAPTLPTRLSSPQEPPPPEEPTPWKDAFVHVGREVSQEAIVGIAMAGLVAVGDALGHPLAGRAVVAGLGAARGYGKYQATASAALGHPVAGTGLALTLGAGTALMAGASGNVLYGAGMGALLGLIQAPRTYPG